MFSMDQHAWDTCGIEAGEAAPGDWLLADTLDFCFCYFMISNLLMKHLQSKISDTCFCRDNHITKQEKNNGLLFLEYILHFLLCCCIHLWAKQSQLFMFIEQIWILRAANTSCWNWKKEKKKLRNVETEINSWMLKFWIPKMKRIFKYSQIQLQSK